MNTDEIIGIVFKAVAGLGFGLLLYFARDLVSQVKTLTTALQANASETQKLTTLVARLDEENSVLRRSHDALTRYLIGKGILPPPDPHSS